MHNTVHDHGMGPNPKTHQITDREEWHSAEEPMSPKTASENAALLSAAAVLKLNTCYKGGHTGYEVGLIRIHAKANVRELMGPCTQHERSKAGLVLLGKK